MVDVRKARKKGKGICVYCGQERNLTKDHLFPRSLFIVLDREMVTVPACHECQRKKELGDRELEIYVTLDILGSNHADAVRHLEKIVDRNEGTRRRLDRMINGADYVTLTTESGFQIAEGLATDFDTAPIIEMLSMVARGLFWFETGHMLPADVSSHPLRIPWNVGMELLRRLGPYRPGEPAVKGNLVVWWSALPVVATDEHDKLWIVCFNDWVIFLLATGTWTASLNRLEHVQGSGDDEEHRFSEGLGLIRHREATLPRDKDGRYYVPSMDLEE